MPAYITTPRAAHAVNRVEAVPLARGPLGRRATDVLGPGAFWPFADVELDAVTLAQILEPLAVHRTLVEKVLVPAIILDESKPLINS